MFLFFQLGPQGFSVLIEEGVIQSQTTNFLLDGSMAQVLALILHPFNLMIRIADTFTP
jgi:hypothetical protein